MDEDDNVKFGPERVKHQDLQMFRFKLNNMSNFQPLEVVGRVIETQLQVGGKIKFYNLAVEGSMQIMGDSVFCETQCRHREPL